jgi:hypothetical protein
MPQLVVRNLFPDGVGIEVEYGAAPLKRPRSQARVFKPLECGSGQMTRQLQILECTVQDCRNERFHGKQFLALQIHALSS